MTIHRNLNMLRITVVILAGMLASYIYYNEDQKTQIKSVHHTCEILQVDAQRNFISFRCFEN